jgi:ketosteroid isomerase-like protein
MSHENVEIVRASYEAWNRGDMNTVRDHLHPDTIMRVIEGVPEPGPFIGRDAVMEQFEQLRGAWDSDTIEPISDFIYAGDRVAVRVAWHCVGRGPEVNLEFTIGYTMRKGQILYQEHISDHAKALEAVGLSEQDAHADS